MNLIFLTILFAFGVLLWRKSGISFISKSSLIAIGTLAIIWWFLWGQLAIADHWWFYNENNVALFYIGFIPAADLLYFFAGVGWHLFFGKKLGIFD